MKKIIIILAVFGLLAATSQAYLTYSGNPAWGPGNVQYYLQLGGTYNAVAQIKLADWSQYMGTTKLVGTTSTSSYGWLDGHNEIAWSDDANINFIWPSNVLAICLPYWNNSGTMLETDIVFNSAFSSSYDSGSLDIGRVLLHEIGHSIGFDHNNGDSIMQPYYGIDHLTADDIAGARFLYANQNGVPDSSSAIVLALIGLSTIAFGERKTKK